MKIGSVWYQGGSRLAVAVGEHHAAIVGGPHSGCPSDIYEVIAQWPGIAQRLADALTDAPVEPVAALHWLPPVPRPGKIVCVALNNSANKERIMSGPDHPATFIKPASSLIGHNQPVRLRPGYGRVHPEPELAVVIGRRATDVDRKDALDYVFGYTVINDLTAPEMRGEDTFHYRAIHPAKDDPTAINYVDSWVSYPGRYKGADTFGPIGPWIATADDIPDPHDLVVRCLHKGQLVTEDNTANLTYKVADVIAFVSSYQMLEPGDVIAMGTALKKAGTARQAVQNVDLTKLGGPIEVSISGIGTLSNTVEYR